VDGRDKPGHDENKSEYECRADARSFGDGLQFA
jgi:hypothetical protein